MQINPYLNFAGDCREAFELYARVLGGKIEMMQSHADSPMKDQTPPDWQDKIMHARLSVGDAVLMGSDMSRGESAKPQGMWVSATVASPADAERVFAGLSEGGQVRMPLQKTFWGTFGMCVDRFGTPWMVNANASG